MIHIPVLPKEVLKYLNPKTNENFIDCTIDGGGHSMAISEKILPNGKILGIDLDEELIRHLKFKIQNAKFKNNLILVNDSYINLKKIVEKYNFRPIGGILLDLGMSSWHLEKSGRGFSFLKDEPLEMRYDSKFKIQKSKFKNNLTAEEIINKWPKEEIEKILEEYGEERFTKRIAEKIIQKREIKPIKSTFQLADIIKEAVPQKYQHQKIHFATRTFQALRIAVNDELNNLKKTLPQIIEILPEGGRIVIISFHSLEDRIIKNFLKGQSKKEIKILTEKPIIATKEEIKINKRSRSAKLRAAIKI